MNTTTFFCFRVSIDNSVAVPVSDIFEMTADEFLSHPDADGKYIDGEIIEPTLWGYDDYATCRMIYKQQEANAIHSSREIIEKVSNDYLVKKRVERNSYYRY